MLYILYSTYSFTSSLLIANTIHIFCHGTCALIFQGLQLLTECYEIVSSESRAPYKELWIQWLNMLMKFIKFGKDEDLYEIIFQFFNPQHSIVKVFETYLTKHVSKLYTISFRNYVSW